MVTRGVEDSKPGLSTVSTELNLSKSRSGPQMKVTCPLQPHMESRCYQRHLKAALPRSVSWDPFLFQQILTRHETRDTVDSLRALWKSPGTAVGFTAGSQVHLAPCSLPCSLGSNPRVLFPLLRRARFLPACGIYIRLPPLSSHGT